jgi:hypothetical protein
VTAGAIRPVHFAFVRLLMQGGVGRNRDFAVAISLDRVSCRIVGDFRSRPSGACSPLPGPARTTTEVEGLWTWVEVDVGKDRAVRGV